MKRVNPQEVAAAYIKTSTTPTPRVFNNQTTCCGLGALHNALLDDDLSEDNWDEWLEFACELGLTRSYAWGYVNGFDGCGPEEYSDGNAIDEDEYALGFCDGVESHRLALVTLGYLEDA